MPGKLIQINHFYLEVVNKINQYKGGNLRDADCRLVFYLSLHLTENIIEEQEDAQNIERRIQILELTHHHLDQYITQNSEADTIGDTVAEYHRNTNQGRDDDGDKHTDTSRNGESEVG